MASVDQGVANHKLGSAIWTGLRVGPRLPVSVPWPHVDLGKLILEILKLGTLSHHPGVELLKIFDIDDRWPPVH
jgi:hypothetical protein